MAGVNYKKARKFVLLAASKDHTSITSEVIDTGDGSTATFTGTFAQTSIEGGSISITDGTETFTDNGDGTLTGSAGGSGTYNTETGAYSVTFNANVTNLQDITASYWYLDVQGSDLKWLEEPEFKFDSNVEDQDPATGGFSGAEGVAGDFWFAFTGKTILSPPDGWANVANEVIGTGDGSTATFSGTLTYPGIHSQAYSALTLADGATAGTTLSITDGTETFTDADGDGVMVGSAGGSGTINYETGAFSVTFNANVTNLQNVTANYCYLPVPECEWAFLGNGHARTWQETNAEGRWEYTPSPYNHAEYGGRLIQIENGGTKGLDHRASGMRWGAKYAAGVRERLMAELNGFGQARTEPVECNLPTRGLLPAQPALVHTKATATITAYPAAGGSKTFAGDLVGGFEQRPPFADTERLETGTGDTTGGTAEVLLNAPAGQKAELDVEIQLTRPKDFNPLKYFKNATRYDITMEWYNRRITSERIRYTCCCYASKVETTDGNEVLRAKLMTKLLHGLPGGSNIGRDTTAELGQWQFIGTK